MCVNFLSVYVTIVYIFGSQAGQLLDLKQAKQTELDLKDKVVVNEGQQKVLLNKLLKRETIINAFTTKLGKLIDENEEKYWVGLTKELYDTYVKDIHREMNMEGIPVREEVKHQRYPPAFNHPGESLIENAIKLLCCNSTHNVRGKLILNKVDGS